MVAAPTSWTTCLEGLERGSIDVPGSCFTIGKVMIMELLWVWDDGVIVGMGWMMGSCGYGMDDGVIVGMGWMMGSCGYGMMGLLWVWDG